MEVNQRDWLIIDKFLGFQTKADPDKIPLGAHAQGQNTIINDGDRISIRNLGSQLFLSPVLDTSGLGTKRLKKFRLRSGANILLRTRRNIDNTIDLEWASPTQWEKLKTGYTSDLFDWAEYNINTDLHSYLYFGNATEDFSRWNGAITLLTAPLNLGDTVVNVVDTSLFKIAPNTIIINGVVLTYNAKTSTTFTLTAPSTVAAATGRGVAQTVETFPANPKGNIYLVSDNRLKIAGVKNFIGITDPANAIFCSGYADAVTFNSTLVTSFTAADPCVFNLGEGGGRVLGMASDEGSDYYAKEVITYKATLTDTTYNIQPIKPFDGKSQTLGIVSTGALFSSRNGTIAITPDNQIFNLSRVEQIDYPQNLPISDDIKPTILTLDFSETKGIYWQDYIYIACRMPDFSYNNVVLVFNSKVGKWESPIVGWNVSDWAIYNDGTGEALYYADSTSANVFKVIGIPSDQDFGITANWRSGQINFNFPSVQKQVDMMYVEGYIAENSIIYVNILLDENGNTQVYPYQIVGNDLTFIYNAPSFNLFGLLAFGTERFGVNNDTSGKKKFRIYFDPEIVPFYNIQVEFASTGINQQWEVTRFGFRWQRYDKPTKDSLHKNTF